MSATITHSPHQSKRSSCQFTHSRIADKAVGSRLYVHHHWLALHRQQETQPAVEVSRLVKAYDGIHQSGLKCSGESVGKGRNRWERAEGREEEWRGGDGRRREQREMKEEGDRWREKIREGYLVLSCWR